MLCNGRTVFVADSNVHDMPNASQLANITQESAEVVRDIFGIEPRAALVSYSNFGKPFTERSVFMRDAKKILDERNVDCEMYDPYVDDISDYNFEKGVYFIGTMHPDFNEFDFPNGSIVIDPWRYIKNIDGVTIIRVGGK